MKREARPGGTPGRAVAFATMTRPNFTVPGPKPQQGRVIVQLHGILTALAEDAPGTLQSLVEARRSALDPKIERGYECFVCRRRWTTERAPAAYLLGHRLQGGDAESHLDVLKI